MTAEPRAADVSTKDRIIEATLQLVASRGLTGTSVTEIEMAAGLAAGRGGFYRHFASKEAALDAAVERELDKLRERFATSRAAPTVVAELKQGLRGLEDLAPLIAIVMRGADLQPEALRSLRSVMSSGPATHGLENVTEAAREAGQDPQAAAVVVTMASVGFHFARHFLKGAVHGISEEAFVKALAEMVSAGSSGSPDSDASGTSRGDMRQDGAGG